MSVPLPAADLLARTHGRCPFFWIPVGPSKGPARKASVQVVSKCPATSPSMTPLGAAKSSSRATWCLSHSRSKLSASVSVGPLNKHNRTNFVSKSAKPFACSPAPTLPRPFVESVVSKCPATSPSMTPLGAAKSSSRATWCLSHSRSKLSASVSVGPLNKHNRTNFVSKSAKPFACSPAPTLPRPFVASMLVG